MKITVDTKHVVRDWPHVEKYQNTTLRYTPSPDFPNVMEKVLGRPKIIRLFITLDEVWDYRDDTYDWDYAIGVNKYLGDPVHYAYDWPLTVPSPVNAHIQEYLLSHAACADEVLLNLRRYEREAIDGVITLDKYEEVVENVIRHYKRLIPNLAYIECCNEVELEQFGNLKINEYVRLLKRVIRSVARINATDPSSTPIKVGGFGMSFGISHWDYWVDFLTELSQDPELKVDFYSMHEYHTDPNRITVFYLRHQALLHELKLPDLPLFMTEYGLRVGVGDAGRPTNIQNAAGEIAGMIIGSHCQNLRMFPWCTFHNPNQQLGRTMFLLIDKHTYVPTPSGHTMTMFKMLGEKELHIEEDLENKAVATIDDHRIGLLVSNPGKTDETMEITFRNLLDGNYTLTGYMVDANTNNILTDPNATSLQATRSETVDVVDATIRIIQPMIGDSFILYTLSSNERE